MDELLNLDDFEAAACERLPAAARDYVRGGAADEITLHENREAFRRFQLLPRVLRDVSNIDLTIDLFGERLSFPVLVAPTAFHSLAHPEGELATARAAAAAGTVMVVSTMSSYRLEEIAAAASAPKWFQLYCYRDRSVTRALVERAEAAGYRAICMTVDLPRVGRRERDLRNRFSLPPGVSPKNFEDFLDLGRLAADERVRAFERYIGELVDPSLTWEAVDWLRSVTRLPLILKGIMTRADARLAAERGVQGIVVSNHGGRQLDTVPAAVEVLGEIVEEAGERVVVLMDGGIRRGTDVAKALALGARAVLVGRPCFYGLAVAGAEGVRRVLELLKSELELTLALLGCRNPREVTREYVRRSS
ncbi:MAG: alpha-hydroxy-acid oxidizing enzyme [Gemmatimonadales bacterium]|nr:MAG: alpha-hydroxy-acid oxidizing enzyme [Gemmatimonadales bacterium]